MLSDLLFALRRLRWDQVRYFRHTYSPFSPWRHQIAAVIEATRQQARRYGIDAAVVDRRRAYQAARMVVPDRLGEHLVDTVPDAYLAYSPPSAATYHAGRRKIPSPQKRREAFLSHPQILAYLLTPPRLARVGLGTSPAGGLVVIGAGEATIDQETLVRRLQEASRGKASGADCRAYAEILLRLHAGVAEADKEEQPAAA